jgi:hypothetical protein
MPVYWITLLPPIIGCYFLGVKIEYPGYGFVVAALGLQAISGNLYIPPVNGPLWSLSVELYLSASLLIMGKWRQFSGFFILTLLVIVNLVFPGHVILQGLPIFYFGYLAPGFRNCLSTGRLLRVALALIPLAILLFTPKIVQSTFGAPFNFLFNTCVAASILIWSLVSSKSERDLISNLSQRSYSLYAVHAPIVLLIDRILFTDSKITSGQQIFLSIAVILVATEILYRFVEKPSIIISRQYLSNHAL